jgi:pyridoxal phosphate enzyme (YggS family)
MSIAENIVKLKSSLPQNVNIIAISKTRSKEEILDAYNAGQRDFGENKVQELISKAGNLPANINWHLVGHLQSNKVRNIAPFINLIHSIDSLKLLSEINKEALRNKRAIHCLLQFFIATEETKFGLSLEEGIDILRSAEFNSMQNVIIAGVMGMASFTEDKQVVRAEFRELMHIFTELKAHFFSKSQVFKELSMGMSGDYLLAIEEGSTMVRLGTIIFGERN